MARDLPAVEVRVLAPGERTELSGATATRVATQGGRSRE